MYQTVIDFIRALYRNPAFIPLHEPRFLGNEKKYVADAIESTFVSSVGEYVNRFEKMVQDLTGAVGAVATVNGTAALHAALLLAGVRRDDEVITQPISFVATANAIAYCGAAPAFLDVDRSTLGLSAEALEEFLRECTYIRKDGRVYDKANGRRIGACVPMHTFAHPCAIDRIAQLCKEFCVPLVEDAAESLGSLFRGRHSGTYGRYGIFSFNGNKTVTSGGGGIIVTSDPLLAQHAKHLTTTAKLPHPYEYDHDIIGYNYRLPNLNAALACAQLEQLDGFLRAKRRLAQTYAAFFQRLGLPFIVEPKEAQSNYWMNAILLPDRRERDVFLEATNKGGVMTRPLWRLLNRLPMYTDCVTDSLENARWLADRIVNIPSSVIPAFLHDESAGRLTASSTPGPATKP